MQDPENNELSFTPRPIMEGQQRIKEISSIQNLLSVNDPTDQWFTVDSPSPRSKNSKKKDLLELITCKICKGYLIDAATLDICMHSFCRPCVVKFMREKPMCPECHFQIKDKRFLNRLKSDVTLQSIVYKVVPGLYEKEMARRREYYAAKPTSTPRYQSEMFGDIPASKKVRPDDVLKVCLTSSKLDCPGDPIKTYLFCRADSTILVLKKLIIAKFGLETPIRIYYGNFELFFDLTTLMDVAATYNWSPNNKIMNLSFKTRESENSLDNSANSSPLTNSVHDPWNGP